LVVLEAVRRLTGEAHGDGALLLERLEGALPLRGFDRPLLGVPAVTAARGEPERDRCGGRRDRQTSASTVVGHHGPFGLHEAVVYATPSGRRQRCPETASRPEWSWCSATLGKSGGVLHRGSGGITAPRCRGQGEGSARPWAEVGTARRPEASEISDAHRYLNVTILIIT